MILESQPERPLGAAASGDPHLAAKPPQATAPALPGPLHQLPQQQDQACQYARGPGRKGINILPATQPTHPQILLSTPQGLVLRPVTIFPTLNPPVSTSIAPVPTSTAPPAPSSTASSHPPPIVLNWKPSLASSSQPLSRDLVPPCFPGGRERLPTQDEVSTQMIADRREKRKWYNATYYNKLHPDVPAKKNKRSREGNFCSRCRKDKVKETVKT